MDEEQLILLVQDYSFLYDLMDSQYSNQLARDNAWEEISQKINCPVKDCRTKWKNLRDGYKKALAGRKTKSGQAATKKKPWRFEKEMSFLEKFVGEGRKSKSNVKSKNEEDDSEADDGSDDLESPNPENDVLSTTEAEMQEDGTGMESSIIDTPLKPKSSKKKSSTPTLHSDSKASSTPVSAASILQQYLSLKKSKSETTEKKDALHKYFAGIEETVRTFPPHLQIRVKSQISTIIHNVEYEVASETARPAMSENFNNFLPVPHYPYPPQTAPQASQFPNYPSTPYHSQYHPIPSSKSYGTQSYRAGTDAIYSQETSNESGSNMTNL